MCPNMYEEEVQLEAACNMAGAKAAIMVAATVLVSSRGASGAHGGA